MDLDKLSVDELVIMLDKIEKLRLYINNLISKKQSAGYQ